ncbi:methyltransferase [Arenibacter sp. ARW7G5Y1]|uniref:methyltransferase n=1 Tax=Arenibacter sp. ARW7G5Y1 TaxID=2135619 RepID=UPI000D76DCA2|nr:methyltransferase [Arenibacter sp. ARW7G5Y1]PXX24583.1 methyltransferase family protein [Arenibacter sp. ARW7G5Y1]
METTAQTQIDPSKIMQVGTGFFATKTLLTAVNMELFTILAKRELSANEIQSRLGLHARSLYDYLDALVALGFLNRKGIKESALYSNSEDADFFLDKNKPSYIGGILEMCNNRLYPFWNNLEDGLKTGLPQNEAKDGGQSPFEIIYANPDKLREFIRAMTGVQMGNFIAFVNEFDFSNYSTLCDIGGSAGTLSAHVTMKNPHMQCTTFDLPPVSPIAQENLDAMGLGDKVKVVSGDFFTDNFPKADVITMGQILHDWGTKDKKMLVKKAYDALPKGGALVVIENIIDKDRRKNAFGLLMSLNMLIETPEGYDFSTSDFDGLAKEAGFTKTSIIPLAGPSSAGIAIK